MNPLSTTPVAALLAAVLLAGCGERATPAGDGKPTATTPAAAGSTGVSPAASSAAATDAGAATSSAGAGTTAAGTASGGAISAKPGASAPPSPGARPSAGAASGAAARTAAGNRQAADASAAGGSAMAAPDAETIRQAQRQLAGKGHDPGRVDGIIGPQTRRAAKSFQQTQGIEPSGELDQRTLSALGVGSNK